MTLAPARPASTVVIVRAANTGIEVFLVKRHDNVAFMGGAHVFPGGRVDAADRLEVPGSLCDGADDAAARMPDLAPADAVAHYVAAVRELFEEAGVLLARTPTGAIANFAGVDAARLREDRRGLAAREMTMREMAEREGLRLALDALVPFAHWITPEIEIKRFDTRFFVAAVPAGQEPVHDDTETIESTWLAPHVALEMSRRQEIALPPPTWTTLRLLAKLTTVEDVLAWARARRVVPVQPGFIRTEAMTMLTLPGDPTYPPIEGFEALEETRFILERGRWTPVAP